MNQLTLVPVKNSQSCSDIDALKRQEADGFRIAQTTLVKPQAWKVSDGDKALLIEHHVMQTKRKDVSTVERKIIGIPGKPRYYVIDDEKLAAVRAFGNHGIPGKHPAHNGQVAGSSPAGPTNEIKYLT